MLSLKLNKKLSHAFSSEEKFTRRLGRFLGAQSSRQFSLSLFLLLGLVPTSVLAKQTTPAEAAQYAEQNWGLNGGDAKSHIHAREAWNAAKPKKDIIVAVIDTGIDSNHPLIKDHLWKTKGSDEYGYDFVAKQKNPKDVHGHGTHVAGIILATSGVPAGKSRVKIMPLRYYADNIPDADQLDFTVKAIDYAVAHGASVINYSAEGVGFSRAEYQAISRAKAKGVIFVTAAGNRGRDNDTASSPSYPASYDLSNIIAVAATNQRNELIPSSNWGAGRVHVAAPGENIFSSLPGSKWGYLTGTSQATAFVTGLAAMVLCENPDLKPEEVRAILEKSSDPEKGLKAKVASSGRVNALAALELARSSANRALSSGKGGLTVTSLEAGSVFQKLGLKMGDVLLSADGRPLPSAQDLETWTKTSLGKSAVAKLQLERDGKLQELTFELAK
jgi:subtilisin family serine protease